MCKLGANLEIQQGLASDVFIKLRVDFSKNALIQFSSIKLKTKWKNIV